MQPLRGPPSVI